MNPFDLCECGHAKCQHTGEIASCTAYAGSLRELRYCDCAKFRPPSPSPDTVTVRREDFEKWKRLAVLLDKMYAHARGQGGLTLEAYRANAAEIESLWQQLGGRPSNPA